MPVPPVRPLAVRGAVKRRLAPRAPQHLAGDCVLALDATRVGTPPHTLGAGLDGRVPGDAGSVHRAVLGGFLLVLALLSLSLLRLRLAHPFHHSLGDLLVLGRLSLCLLLRLRRRGGVRTLFNLERAGERLERLASLGSAARVKLGGVPSEFVGPSLTFAARRG